MITGRHNEKRKRNDPRCTFLETSFINTVLLPLLEEIFFYTSFKKKMRKDYSYPPIRKLGSPIRMNSWTVKRSEGTVLRYRICAWVIICATVSLVA